MKRIFGLLLLVMLLSATTFAQGSGSSAQVRKGRSERPFAVTKSITGKVAEVKATDRLIVVSDAKGARHEIRVDDKTRFRMSPASGRSLALADLKAGQTAKVFFRAADQTATIVMLLK